MVLGSGIGKYSQLSSNLPLVYIGGAQPWPHRVPQPGAGLSRHALADGRPGCTIELVAGMGALDRSSGSSGSVSYPFYS